MPDIIKLLRRFSSEYAYKACRSLNQQISLAMDKIFSHIENNDECQYTLTELLNLLDKDDYKHKNNKNKIGGKIR